MVFPSQLNVCAGSKGRVGCPCPAPRGPCPLPVLPASFAASDVPVWQAVRPRYCMTIKAGAYRMKSMLYQAYQNHMDLTEPWRRGAASALKYLNLAPQGMSDKLFGRLSAALELISRSSLSYARPAYGIDRVQVGNRELEVTEEVVYATPFGSLLRFRKEDAPEQPRLLLVAPMSDISRRCCAAPSRPCCRTTTSTSPTGITRATSRSTRAGSASTSTPNTSSPFSASWGRARTWLRSASRRCRRSPRQRSCRRMIIPRAPQA